MSWPNTLKPLVICYWASSPCPVPFSTYVLQFWQSMENKGIWISSAIYLVQQTGEYPQQLRGENRCFFRFPMAMPESKQRMTKTLIYKAHKLQCASLINYTRSNSAEINKHSKIGFKWQSRGDKNGDINGMEALKE